MNISVRIKLKMKINENNILKKIKIVGNEV